MSTFYLIDAAIAPRRNKVRLRAAKKGNMIHPTLDFELQVFASNGVSPLREYGHNGRTFIEGKSGSIFWLKFRNNTASRVLAVCSVDGLSAVEGQPATDASKGYVVSAYSTACIRGWRRTLAKSADFVFTDKAKSYASQTAGGQNSGVIAVKVFAEVVRIPAYVPTVVPIEVHHHHHHYPAWRPCSGIMFSSSTTGGSALAGVSSCLANGNVGMTANTVQMYDAQITAKAEPVASAPAFNLGTGWGTEKDDQVSECSFERGSVLATLEIFYDDAAGLSNYGVQLYKDVAVSAPAFPVSFGGFCQPPRITV